MKADHEALNDDEKCQHWSMGDEEELKVDGQTFKERRMHGR